MSAKNKNKEPPKQRGRSKSAKQNKQDSCMTSLTETDTNKHFCKICYNCLTNPEVINFQCQRCEARFCLPCLGKEDDEYEIFCNSDLMWFCTECNLKVKQNIEIDKRIEEKCEEITKTCMDRIKEMEKMIENKCNETDVINIVKNIMAESGGVMTNLNGKEEKDKQNVASVMSEMNERKERELNIIVYGQDENSSENRQDRVQHDKERVKEVCKICDVEIDDSDMTKVIRLGKYNKDTKNRPILISLRTLEIKKEYFTWCLET